MYPASSIFFFFNCTGSSKLVVKMVPKNIVVKNVFVTIKGDIKFYEAIHNIPMT